MKNDGLISEKLVKKKVGLSWHDFQINVKRENMMKKWNDCKIIGVKVYKRHSFCPENELKISFLFDVKTKWMSIFMKEKQVFYSKNRISFLHLIYKIWWCFNNFLFSGHSTNDLMDFLFAEEISCVKKFMYSFFIMNL